MQNDPIINKELLELSPLLAGIPNSNIFRVPEGYFENFPSQILGMLDDTFILSSNKPSIRLDVPEGYFNSLADSILSKIKSQAGDAAVEGTDTTSFDQLKQVNVYTLPPGYFTALPDNILSRIRSGQLEAFTQEPDTSFIDGVKRVNVYQLPDNYFSSLPHTILNQLPKATRVIKMNNRTSFLKYAIAAAVTGILGLSLFTLFDKKSGEVIPQLPMVLAQVNSISNAENISEVFQTLREEDIVNYLEKNGEDVNAALVASVTDEMTLPSEEDYYTDEKTLDNFLQNQHILHTSDN